VIKLVIYTLDINQIYTTYQLKTLRYIVIFTYYNAVLNITNYYYLYMPHISKQKLPPEKQREISEQLITTLLSLPRSTEGKKFLNEFFTHTEKIMLAKRLALIHSLNKKTLVTQISELLKMSPSTIQKTSLKIENGRYSSVIKILDTQSKAMDKMLKAFVSFISPQRMTSKRWEWLDSI